jgi:hypothetical protein
MGQPSARDRLAKAHNGMSGDEIAEHALALAAVVESQDQLLRNVVETAVQLRELVDVTIKVLTDVQTAVRRAQSLTSSHRKREARELVAEIAAMPLFRDQVEQFHASTFVPAEDAWPEIFSPKGTAQ